MKKTLQRTGAIGLAAATIVTGLSFGPAAPASASAPDSGSGIAAPPPTGTKFKLVGQGPDGTYYGTTSLTDDRIRDYTSYEEAFANSAWLESIRVDDTFQMKATEGASAGRCYYASPKAQGNPHIGFSTCGIFGNHFRIGTDGRVVNTSRSLAIGTPVTSNGKRVFSLSNSNPLMFAGIEGFTGTVATVDLAQRSAQLTGTGAPGSFVVISGGDLRPVQTPVEADSTWSVTVRDLKIGSNPLTLEQWKGSEKTGETTVDAELKVAPVTGGASFPDDLEKDAVLSGTAQPGATIVIRDVNGTEIARTDARLGSGTWSTPITAPNAGGDYDVRVHQEIDDEPTGEIIVTVAYGAAVTITTPVEDSAHDGGPVTMRGTGEVGARVVVREQGRSTVLGDAEVLANGQWTIRTTNVDDRKHVLEVTQTGKGDNTTTSTVTLNPEASEIAPVTVTNPADASVGYTPNTSFTFRGTGTANKTLQVENKFGTTLGSTTVLANGTWSWTRANMGTSNWTINFIQDKSEATQSIATVLNFAPSTDTPAPAPLVTVTNPADAKDGYVPNTSFTFEGTGTANKTLQVENKFGTTLGSTTVRTNGTWSWTRANMGTSIWSINFIQDKGTATEAKATVANFAPTAETPAPAPRVTVTNPADAKDGYVPNTSFTFEGTGTANKTLQVENKFGTTLGNTTVRTNGTWSWTRANMGTSTWSINFIQDKGTDDESMAQVVDFAPRG